MRLSRENDSLKKGDLDKTVDDSRLVESPILQSSNIIVTAFCPIGGKPMNNFYSLKELKDSDDGLSLRLRIERFPSTIYSDSIYVKISYPVIGKKEPKVYLNSMPIARTKPSFIMKGNYNSFSKGSYKYEITNKDRVLKRGSFEMR